jgi:hypothetical protein
MNRGDDAQLCVNRGNLCCLKVRKKRVLLKKI